MGEVPSKISHKGSIDNVPELNLDIEEADALIILHAMHAIEHGPERLIVYSSVTEVFVLLIYYENSMKAKGL